MFYIDFGRFTVDVGNLSAKRLVGIESEEVVFRSVFIGIRSRPSSYKGFSSSLSQLLTIMVDTSAITKS